MVGGKNKAGRERGLFQGFKLGLLVAKLFPVRRESLVAASLVGGRLSVLIREIWYALRRSLLSCHGMQACLILTGLSRALSGGLHGVVSRAVGR